MTDSRVNDNLALKIKQKALQLGFQQCGITDLDLKTHGGHLQRWLEQGYHGEMEYMARHGEKRFRPEALVPGTRRVISVRMDYRSEEAADLSESLADPDQATISRYALGRDYHKVMRKKLAQLATYVEQLVPDIGYRVFVDSAPVLERALAEKAGLGWIGKNTMLINPKAGSYFFLGELFTDLPLPVDPPFTQHHCGSCSACLDICPTGAFVAPQVLDARRCISYLTIELKGSIPEELRPLLGNRIFGCDDCQQICPWNKFSRFSDEPDFTPRHRLDQASLLELFSWDEDTFLTRTAGSTIRRTGYQSWLRNIAVALGNGPNSEQSKTALQRRLEAPDEQVSPMVKEHIEWALHQLAGKPAHLASDR